MYDQTEPDSLDPINIPKTASATVTEKTSDYTWGPTKVHNFYTHNPEMGITHFDELDPYSTTDLLTLLHLPKYSFTSSSNTPLLGNSVFNFPTMMVDNPSGSGTGSGSGSGSSTISHDPLFNFPLSQLMFQQSFTDGFNAEREIDVCGNGNSSFLFDDGKENTNTINGYYDEDNNTLFHDFNGVFEFSKDDKKVGKLPKSSFTEKQRRKNFSDKYQDLRSLIPNQTKDDRASIILDAINHIKELKRTLGELKILVAKKRMNKPDQQNPGGEPDPEEVLNGFTAMQLRSSWVHRKCKDIELDVRILDDEISIKIVQRKKINCLLSVSRILDEFGLDISHVVGALVGDYYTFLFNSKICEGSSVYASEIANKVIDVVERHVVAPTSGLRCLV